MESIDQPLCAVQSLLACTSHCSRLGNLGGSWNQHPIKIYDQFWELFQNVFYFKEILASYDRKFVFSDHLAYRKDVFGMSFFVDLMYFFVVRMSFFIVVGTNLLVSGMHHLSSVQNLHP